MRRTTTSLRLAACAVLAFAGVSHGQEATLASAEFDDLCARIQRHTGAAAEADVLRVFKLGRDVGRPYSAAVSTRNYMARHRDPSDELLQAAIENAFLIGDMRAAVSRCKAYLEAAHANPIASDIAPRMYAAQSDFP